MPVRKRPTPRGRLVDLAHLELVALAEPALYGLAQPPGEIPSHVQIARRARPGVQILVGAANRKVHPRLVQAYGHGASAMAEIA